MSDTEKAPDSDTSPETATVEPDPPFARTARWPLPRRAMIVIGGALTLATAGLAAGGYFGWQNHHQRALDHARDSAREAACAYGSVLANYDAANLDSYFAAVLDHATGEWKQEFQATSKDLRDVLTQGQVHSTTGTIQCGIATNDEVSAEAIVVIDQSVASVGTQSQPRRGQLAITLSLAKTGSTWLTSKVSSPLLRPS